MSCGDCRACVAILNNVAMGHSYQLIDSDSKWSAKINRSDKFSGISEYRGLRTLSKTRLSLTWVGCRAVIQGSSTLAVQQLK